MKSIDKHIGMNMSINKYTPETHHIRDIYKEEKSRMQLYRLLYICKWHGINHRTIPKHLSRWVSVGYTDSVIVSLLRTLQDKNFIHIDDRDRGANRASDVYSLLEDPTQINNYLDIGAGDCKITKAVANKLGVDYSNTYAIDIDKWSNKINKDFEHEINFIDASTSKICNSKYNLGQGKFDLITLFQTLHHINDMNNVIKEVYRLLKPGGVCIIREHDARSEVIKKLCHVEHLLYAYFADGMKLLDFYNEYYAQYYSKVEMVNLFKSAGFKEANQVIKNNPTLYYYQVFIKI